MSTNKFFISLFIAPAFITWIIAGSMTANAQTINEEVTVIGAFEPTIPDADKMSLDPPDSETDVKLPEMTYSNQPSPMMVTLKPESISSVRLIGEPLKKLYNNYVKAGFGTYTTPFLDLYTSSLRSKEYALGLHIKHLSSSGKIEDYPNANNSLNLIDVYGQKFLDQHTLSANLGFCRNVVHHYGFLTSEFNETSFPNEYFYSNDDLKQRFARVYGSVGIKSNYSEKDKINHFADLKFKSISDLFNTRETSILLSGGADKQFEILDFTDHQQLGMTADLSFTGYKDSTLSQKSTLITLKPFISTSFNEYTFKAGLNINFKLDTVSKAYLFPFAEGQLRIIDDALIVHAGFTGDLSRQSFDELSDVNPFVQSVLPLEYTREKFTFYAGVRARAGSNIDLSATVRSSFVENAAFFVNDYRQVPYNRFTLVHDDGKVIKGRVEAEYHTAEHIMLKAFLGFESWSLDTLIKADHTPVLTFGIDAMYQIQNKIVVRANVAARSKQYARVPGDSGEVTFNNIKGFADLSLGIEYRYTKVLSGFINFNNITNTRYFLFNNYPSYRFNLMGGVAYSF